MGWASASGIFIEVAKAVVETGVPDDKVMDICERLIHTLSNDDWDTQDEAMEMFADNPAVMEAFRKCGYEPYE